MFMVLYLSGIFREVVDKMSKPGNERFFVSAIDLSEDQWTRVGSGLFDLELRLVILGNGLCRCLGKLFEGVSNIAYILGQVAISHWILGCSSTWCCNFGKALQECIPISVFIELHSPVINRLLSSHGVPRGDRRHWIDRPKS